MSEVFEIAGWMLLSSVKYIVAILTLLAKSPRFWFYDMLIVSAGGAIAASAARSACLDHAKPATRT